MQKSRFLKALAVTVMLTMTLTGVLAGCGNTIGEAETSQTAVASQSQASATQAATAEKTKIEIFTRGWVNTPTDANDPFKKYIDEKYGVDVILSASADFANQIVVKFASDEQPDIVSFESDTVDVLNQLYDQGSLLGDWTPYLAQMPNMQKVIAGTESTNKMFTKAGKLTTLWSTPPKNTWSLKIRKDWMEKLNLQAPKTPEDLLNIARAFTNNDPDGNGKKDTYGFTSAGGGQTLGLISSIVANMYGDIWYIDNNQVTNGIVSGVHKKALDFIKTVVSEKLIDPNWYVQKWAEKLLDKQGKVGIDWYPGVIAAETESTNGNKGNTVGWWDTYDIPKDPSGGPTAGLMQDGGLYSRIITVGAKTALDKNKMDKVCQIINDLLMTPDGVRTETYDALRWGVGVENGLKMLEIPGTTLKYVNTNGNGALYRDNTPGAWDWGQWFSVPLTDGVIQGDTDSIGEVTIANVKMDEKTFKMATAPSLAMLTFDPTINLKLTQLTNEFEYKYVTGKTSDYDGFVANWKTQGGNQLLIDAQKQLKDFGLVK